MSHVSEMELKILSMDALKAACGRLGLEFVEGQKTYRWYGQFMGDYTLPAWLKVEDLGKCEHAIRVPGARYEIGIVHHDGEIKLLWDFYSSGGLEKVLGKQGGKLKQAYTVEQAKMTARRAGYRVTEKRTLMDRLRGAVGMQKVDGIRITLRRG